MQRVHRVRERVSSDRSVRVENLPFAPGTQVEILVVGNDETALVENRYPLRGKPMTLVDPTDSVAEEDWDVLR